MAVNKVTIIGLGLIGGSLARALNERLGMRDITAINRSAHSIESALRDGCISRGFTDLGENEHVFNSDIIFICTPTEKTTEYIDRLAGKVKPGCIITDVGSTKEKIMEHVNNMADPPCFIGGHPMAGTEKTGYEAGFSHLFENAYYILTPGRSTTDEALECMTGIIKGIGGIPVILDAREHDRITGGISHVPHVIASALVNLVREMDTEDGKMQMLAAGGFKDITRIASSSPEIWESIILSNRGYVKEILEDYIEVLNNFKNSVESGDREAIYGFFDSARKFRDSIPPARKSVMVQEYDILVDVVDRPGIISSIATILANNGINIKNINVSNSREFEQGCLRITLPDLKSANTAHDLLAASGYRVYKSS